MWCWLIHELTMNVGFTICLVFTRSILITPYFIYIYIYIYIYKEFQPMVCGVDSW